VRSWSDKFGKDVLTTLFERHGEVESEHQILAQVQSADVFFRPVPAGVADDSDAHLGVMDHIAALGSCIVELYSRTPVMEAGYDCVRKHLSLHRQRAAKGKPRLPLQALWIISPGRPHMLLKALAMQPMDGWPPGVWRMPGLMNVHLISVRELPVTRDTLFLRLLGRGKTRTRAIAELHACPESPVRRELMQVIVAWGYKIFETSGEDTMLPETRAIYEEWKSKVQSEGRKEGHKAGHKAGRKEGERAVLRKLLQLRFGALPAGVEDRLKRATRAQLSRWTERILNADTLAAVLDS
jgi:hypothetical protein